MSTHPDSNGTPEQSLRDRFRRSLPGGAAVLGLLGIAKAGQVAESHRWWIRGEYELLSLVIVAAIIGASCIAFFTISQAAIPKVNGALLRRVLSMVFFAAIGLKVGLCYVHLCEAGSRWLERLAALGTPLLVGTVVFFCRRLVLGYLLGLCLLTIIWLLARPYLDWAHGN